MTDITPERLAEIKALAKAATAGPWLVVTDDDVSPLSGRPSVSASEDLDCGITQWDGFVQEYWRNAAFIAAARQDIPDLIAALEAAQAENAKLREEFDAAKVLMLEAAETFAGVKTELRERFKP